MVQHYLKVALRNLLKYKSHSLISAICLSVGLVCFSMIGYIIDKTVGGIDKLPNYERRVDFKMPLENNPDGSKTFIFRQSEVKNLEERKVEGIEAISCHSFRYEAEMLFIDKEQQEHPFQVTNRRVNSTFFSYYDAKMLYGNTLPKTPNEVVLSESCARRVYGNQNPVGMLITKISANEKEEKKTFKIVNVCTDLPMELSVEAELFIPCEGNSFNEELYVQGLLTANADLEQINQTLEHLKVNRYENTMHYIAILLSQQHDDPLRLAVIAFVTLLSSLVLLSGMINFLKFIIQMFYNRQRELALRKYMGSSAKGMFALLFAEVVWMFTVSFLLSLALTEIIIPCIYSYVPKEKMFPIQMSEIMWKQFKVFIGLLLVCMGVILVPIRRLQSVSIISHVSRRQGRHIFRNFMMGLQLCVCILFLGISSGFVINLLIMDDYVYDPLSGEETKDIIRLNINTISMGKQKEKILTEIRQLPEIEQTIFTSQTKDITSNSYTYTTYKEKNGNDVSVAVLSGSADYFDFFRIPLQGRKVETDAQGIVYISETFAQRLEQDTVQGMVKLGEDIYRIGGIYKGLHKEYMKSRDLVGSVFFANKEARSYCFRINENENVEGVIKQIRQICYRYVPESLPLSIFTLNKEKKIADTAFEMMRDITFLLAVVSLLLVVLSIYSSISMDTLNRQKEVAIRKINGATPRSIALIFGKSYGIIYLLAFSIAFPLTYLLVNGITKDNNLVEEFCFGYWSIGLFIGIAALVVLTTGFKIYRIMHINPSKIIKTE